MSVTGGIMAGVGLAGSLGGAALQSSAAGNAASTQAQAAEQAAQLQYQASQNALDFQKQQWNTEQQNLAPWLNSGTGALSNLDYLLGISPMTSQQFTSSPSQASPLPGTGGGTVSPIGSPQLPSGGGGYPAPRANPVLPGGRPSSELAQHTAPISSTLDGLTQGGPSGPDANPIGASGAVGYRHPVANPVGFTPSIGSQGGGMTPQGGGSPGGFGSLLAPYGQTFSAPTLADMEQNDPGYQARLNMQEQALQQSAAARGNLLTGGTAQAIGQLGQDYASNEYNNYYNRAYNTFASNYNQYQQQQANTYNRLAALAGIGQTTAGQLGQLGQSASNNVSQNLLSTAYGMGQQYNNAAAANASGMIGSANAWSGALGGTSSNIQNLLLLQQLQNMGGGGGGGVGYGGGVSGDFSIPL